MERLIADKFDVDVYHKRLTKELVDRYHAAGMKVNCWTVNHAEDGERLAEWGVDFITTNILE
jgi:glycerophosphoryl diester phosphodiesterase